MAQDANFVQYRGIQCDLTEGCLSNVERNSATSQEDALVNAEESSVTLHTTEFWKSIPPSCTCTFCTFMVYVDTTHYRILEKHASKLYVYIQYIYGLCRT